MKRLAACVTAFCFCLFATSSLETPIALAGGGTECVGDVNGDGETGIFDFLAVFNAFGQDCSAEPCDEDVDGDDVVGIGDLLAVLMDFGCGQEGCETNADCDDGNDCTIDFCFHGLCFNIPMHGCE